MAYLEDGLPGLVSVVIKHNYSKSAKDRVDPLPSGYSWLINGGDPIVICLI